MARPKKFNDEEVSEIVEAHIVDSSKSEKELLTECYEFMKSRGINSISDVENLLARLN